MNQLSHNLATRSKHETSTLAQTTYCNKTKHSSLHMTTYYIKGIKEAEKYDVERNKNKTICYKNGKQSFTRAILLQIKRNTEIWIVKGRKKRGRLILKRATRKRWQCNFFRRPDVGKNFTPFLYWVSLNWGAFKLEKRHFWQICQKITLLSIFSIFGHLFANFWILNGSPVHWTFRLKKRFFNIRYFFF